TDVQVLGAAGAVVTDEDVGQVHSLLRLDRNQRVLPVPGEFTGHGGLTHLCERTLWYLLHPHAPRLVLCDLHGGSLTAVSADEARGIEFPPFGRRGRQLWDRIAGELREHVGDQITIKRERFASVRENGDRGISIRC